MSSKNVLVDLSWLFMIRSKTVTITKPDHEGCSHIEIPSDATVIAFSDRPFRLAKSLEGGIVAFAKFFEKSDFKDNPPNVTFAGEFTDKDGNKKEHYTIFEMKDEREDIEPPSNPNIVSFRIATVLGKQEILPSGTYSHISLIVDDYWLKKWNKAVKNGKDLLQPNSITKDSNHNYHFDGSIYLFKEQKKIKNKDYNLKSKDEIDIGGIFNWVEFNMT